MKEKTMKWRPFFSHLLQSRAALLQAITPQSKQQQPTALLQPDFNTAPSQANPHMPAVCSVQQTPTPHSLPQAVTAPSPQAENQPVASVNGGQHQPKFQGQTECPTQAPSAAATPQVSTFQDGASPVSSTSNSNNPSAPPPQPYTLPLIRSKTGRIILPSSLKPRKLRHPVKLIPEIHLYVLLYSYIYTFFFSHSWSGFLYTHGYECQAERRGEGGQLFS